jgi:hypothetical protein
MLSSEEYRYFAEQCREFARRTDAAERRDTLLQMANTWDRLAEKAAEEEETAAQTPRREPEPSSP